MDMKTIEQSIWIETEEDTVIEVILYTDGSSEQKLYTIDGKQI